MGNESKEKQTDQIGEVGKNLLRKNGEKGGKKKGTCQHRVGGGVGGNVSGISWKHKLGENCFGPKANGRAWSLPFSMVLKEGSNKIGGEKKVGGFFKVDRKKMSRFFMNRTYIKSK